MEQTSTIVRAKKLHPDATMPARASAGAACFDICAVDTDHFSPHPNDAYAAIFRTGLSFEIPPGFVMLLFSRSGHGFNSAMRLSNCVGVIDSDYRGEVLVSMRFDASTGDYRCPKIRDGERIAQAMIIPIPAVEFVMADDLGETNRGIGGFGSTNVEVPPGVYYNPEHDNFYACVSRNGMGHQFYANWKHRRDDFPTDHGATPPPVPTFTEQSEREWAATPANLREGCTKNVPGIGDI